MFAMPKAFPMEFRRDVVAVARKGEAPMSSRTRIPDQHAAATAPPISLPPADGRCIPAVLVSLTTTRLLAEE
jgi:hypothetical protein